MDEITITEKFFDEARTDGCVEFRSPNLTWGVDVFVHSRFGGPVEAQVNWGGIGSVDPETARGYAALISAAATYADEFNKVRCPR